MTKVAFIGLGNMGSGMCANLAKSGHDVSAFDLNADAVEKVVQFGAKGEHSIQAAVAGAQTIVTMLPAGKHVASVYFDVNGVAANAEDGSLFLDCSTISVEDARDISGQALARGFDMVDAPVSGGTSAANAGTLTFMVGGSDAAFHRAKPLLCDMGQNIFHAGRNGNGQAAKIANNMLLGISMIATCEAFDLAERLGLDAQTFFDISSKASGQNWSMTSYCPAPGPVPSAPSNNGYAPGFAVDMMLKDLRLAIAASEHVGSSTKFGYLAKQTYSILSEKGLGSDDFSVVMRELSEE